MKRLSPSLLLLLGIFWWGPAVSHFPVSPPEKGVLLYENSFASASQVSDWVMEGPGELSFEKGWMQMQSPREEHHHVLWCPIDFPDRFEATWEVQNLETDAGLLITFFAYTGLKGEDIFEPHLPARAGTFQSYIRDQIKGYHISYYANTPDAPDRGDSHLRKNNTFALVQTGPEGIPPRSEAIHHLRLRKDKAHIQMWVDERKIIDWLDDGWSCGPVYGGGKIGFRQMQWTHFQYRNFKVWALPEESALLPSAEKTLDRTVLVPRFREWPSPLIGTAAKTNPPSLLVPLAKNKQARYSFRLSQNSRFPKDETLGVDKQEWAIYNPHQQLAVGNWFWQSKAEGEEWSELRSFMIEPGVPVLGNISLPDLIARVPQTHPRSLAFASELEAIRKRAVGNPDAARILQEADKALLMDPPEESDGLAENTGSTPTEQKKLNLDASKHLGNTVKKGLDPLVKAYVLTGDERYARAAIRWGLAVAAWDPAGVSMTNNFADSECMRLMADVYDACFALLSETEKAALLRSIEVRAQRFYEGWTQQLESKSFSAHVWQHILERMVKTSLAVLHESPEAPKWFGYLYEIWLSRAPVLGPADGGWWNGTHYFELNALTLLEVPAIFSKLTGEDYLHSPFYANNPYWLWYSFPPNSYSEGFGNGTEKQIGQKLGVLGYADALGRLTGNAYACWYADFHLQKMGKTLVDDGEFRWFRLRWPQNDRPEIPTRIDLPQARVFPQTGTVNMHSNFRYPESNLMLSMRSSPFGSTSHAHADQNSFNLQWGGERIYYNSGYRPAMGVPHYTDWFKASKGHNTVLIDGKEQPKGTGQSYGWMPRFAHGEQISYALGDASHAYDNAGEQVQVAGMKRFRRHLVLLRPGTIVIYDELEADHAANWDWLLHSMEKSWLSEDGQFLFCKTHKAQAQTRILASVPLEIEISTRFDPEPVNFRGMLDEDGELLEYKDQWHIRARPREPQQKIRYLTLIQVNSLFEGGSLSRGFDTRLFKEGEKVVLGGWEISAEMDPEKPASLHIQNAAETALLSLGSSAEVLGGQTFHRDYQQSTLLVEKVKGQWIRQEAIDQLPE